MHSLSDELSIRGAENKFDLGIQYISKWLSTAIRARFSPELTIPLATQEISIPSNLISTKKLDGWVHLWEETNRLAKQVHNINLDRKQIFLSIFFSIGNLLAS